MNDIRVGDGVICIDGARGVVIGSVFKMNSFDPDYFAVPVDFDGDEMPVDMRAIVEVWRDGQPVMQQLGLFEEVDSE